MDQASPLQAYWRLSRTHTYSLLLALPLLLAYELLLLLVNRLRPDGRGVANMAELVLRRLLAAFGAGGAAVLMVALFAVAALLIAQERRRHPAWPLWPLRRWILAAMMLESAAWALVLGRGVGWLTASLTLSPSAFRPLALALGAQSLSRGEGFVLSLGAGLFEELLFRVILVSGAAAALLALQRIGIVGEFFARLGLAGPRRTTLFVAFLSALSFSLMHYVGDFGDRFQLASFVFRLLAGLAFTAVYLLRGFGIVAWSHALYDVGIYLLSPPSTS
ncbi:MAG: type II CAAX prenyl endopeptidase Rce1 family protein [Anaerolineae bacterium]